jgi:hypothetical protein
MNFVFAAEAADFCLETRQHIEDGGLPRATVADQSDFHRVTPLVPQTSNS